jgi:CRISPR-associated protein Csm4
MKLFKTTITPLSNFATKLKGDTIFGQLCWAILFKFGESRLKALLQTYEQKPFLVVSDGFAKEYLPKPKLPQRFLNEEDKKEGRKKIWMSFEDLQNGEFKNAKGLDGDKNLTIMHNSINRKILTTDGEDFAPYSTYEVYFGPKDIYCLIDEDLLSLKELEQIFEFLGSYGYGKYASVGKGRFNVGKFEEIKIDKTSKAIMTLSPFSPQGLKCKTIYYEPFTRFGKKGALFAREKPFKKPLLLADTASVVIFDTPYEKLYIGKAIRGHTTHDDIVHQGYSIAIPIKDIYENILS